MNLKTFEMILIIYYSSSKGYKAYKNRFINLLV